MSEQKPKNHGLAVASLTLGILAIPLGLVGVGLILGILAIVFGSVSLKDNKGKALAGIITGALGIVTAVVVALFVFVIVPNNLEDVQTNQRDTQRKNDVATLLSDVTYRISEDRGQIPDIAYVDDMTYKLVVIDSAISGDNGAQPTTSTAVYQKGTDCDGNDGARRYSITILLENGDKYCQGS